MPAGNSRPLAMRARWYLLVRASVLISIFRSTLVSASTGSYAETRVGGLELSNPYSVGTARAPTLGTHQGHSLGYDELASGCLLAARGAASVAGRVVENGVLRTSATVAEQLAGSRSYIPAPSILQTTESGVRVPDPQGVAGTFMYSAPAVFNNSVGMLEVLVNEEQAMIYHVLFRRGAP